MADTTVRFGIVEPSADRSDPADVPLYIRNAVAALEAMGAIYGQGTHAARPISTSGVPGKQGRLYYETDTQLLFYDYGTGWTQITSTYGGPGAGSITTAMLADNSVTNVKMADNSVGAPEIIDGSVGSAEIADALKPSAGAGGSSEALRALGTAAGTAAAGMHAAQHGRTGADALPIGTFITSGPIASRPSTGLVAGMVYTATDVGGGTSYMYTGSAWVAMAAPVLATVTSLPGSPVDGQTVTLRIGATAPYNYLTVTYDATAGKWASVPITFSPMMEQTANNLSIYTPTAVGTAKGPLVLWAELQALGLIPYVRYSCSIQQEFTPAHSQLAYYGVNNGGGPGGLIQLPGTAVASSGSNGNNVSRYIRSPWVSIPGAAMTWLLFLVMAWIDSNTYHAYVSYPTVELYYGT